VIVVAGEFLRPVLSYIKMDNEAETSRQLRKQMRIKKALRDYFTIIDSGKKGVVRFEAFANKLVKARVELGKSDLEYISTNFRSKADSDMIHYGAALGRI
jgi:hypothetical protein